MVIWSLIEMKRKWINLNEMHLPFKESPINVQIHLRRYQKKHIQLHVVIIMYKS